MWYSLAAAIALIAILSDVLKIAGAVSEPMLWSLFGVAINRIMTHRDIQKVQKRITNPKKKSITAKSQLPKQNYPSIKNEDYTKN